MYNFSDDTILTLDVRNVNSGNLVGSFDATIKLVTGAYDRRLKVRSAMRKWADNGHVNLHLVDYCERAEWQALLLAGERDARKTGRVVVIATLFDGALHVQNCENHYNFSMSDFRADFTEWVELLDGVDSTERFFVIERSDWNALAPIHWQC